MRVRLLRTGGTRLAVRGARATRSCGRRGARRRRAARDAVRRMAVGSAVAGVAAATLTPALGTAGQFLWADHWRGSAVALNAVKCSAAGALFVCVALAQGGLLGVDGRVAGWLVLSGVIGIIVGDTAWLVSLKVRGAARSAVDFP